MNRDCAITASLKRAQMTVFREANKRGITASVIHYDTGGEENGISLSAIGQYARGETAMGMPALIKLIGVIPDELLSLLLPDERIIVRKPAELNHYEISEAMSDYLAEKARAHRPDSEAGEAIGPGEDNVLRAKFAAVAGGRAA